ncbi:hypothetical protein OH76DRAFT_1206171 [Lentinus brumalis]|uniref:Uncharacterized protein n=1 Tax=Lentinus brumalis TaxID=2498619 RepID=A0A371CSV2_9APHY|nr:hypothetical protein OH76DRAFT_1206171 [Polyporus brumalis]
MSSCLRRRGMLTRLTYLGRDSSYLGAVNRSSSLILSTSPKHVSDNDEAKRRFKSHCVKRTTTSDRVSTYHETQHVIDF